MDELSKLIERLESAHDGSLVFQAVAALKAVADNCGQGDCHCLRDLVNAAIQEASRGE